MIETKNVTDRRTLRFEDLDAICAEVDALDGNELRTTGNWTPAQNLQHVTRTIDKSIDGFGVKAPLHIRLVLRAIKGRTLRNPIKPGFQLPEFMAAILPADDVTWTEATEHFRATMVRIADGATMSYPSPAFGKMTHDQWVQLHCRHAELHLGFIQTS